MTRLLATLAAVAGVLTFGGTANADPIFSFSTSTLNFTANPNTGFTASGGVLGSASSTAFVNTPTTVLSGATISNITATITSAPPVPPAGNGTFTLTSTGPGGTFTVAPTAGNGGGVATFQILNPFTNTSGLNNFINLTSGASGQGFLVLQSNTTLHDFGAIGQLWRFNPTVTASAGYAISNSPLGISFSGTPSTSISADRSGLPNLNEVPEPATVAVCGLMGLAGLVAGRRKLKAKKAAEAATAA